MEEITVEKIKRRIREKVRGENRIETLATDEKKLESMKDTAKIYRKIHVNNLSKNDSEQFIKEIYGNVLLREADPDGFNNYVNLLKRGVPKEVVLYSIATSVEAKEQKVEVVGLESLRKSVLIYRLKQAIQKIPFVSSLFIWFYRLMKLPSRFRVLSEAFWRFELNLKTFNNTFNQELARQKIEIDEKDSTMKDLLNSKIGTLSRQLDLFGQELKKEASKHDFPLDTSTYCALENKFRGTRDVIKHRQAGYLEYILKAYQNSKGDYLLDVGCGRGEFLEILSENDIPSRGIDINEANINICKDHGLNVEIADALQFMKSIKNNSLIGVTAFQFVEHLYITHLIELIKISFNKIRNGGIIILETVNPYSFFALKNFFLDPTHKTPIPLETLKLFVEAAGFIDVEVKLVYPVEDAMKLKGDDENIIKLNEILFGFQGYAIIGRK